MSDVENAPERTGIAVFEAGGRSEESYSLTFHSVRNHHELEGRKLFQPFPFRGIVSIVAICCSVLCLNRGEKIGGHTLFGEVIKAIDDPRPTTRRVEQTDSHRSGG